MKEAPRLGRGLASLLGDALNPSPSSSTVGSTAVADLEPNPFQPRGAISTEDLVELAASIREQGLLQPILIRRHPSTPGRFQIIAGERRWRAAQMAGLTTIPSFLRDLPDTAASAAALVENLQRENLNPIEEAEGFKRLVDGFGLTKMNLPKRSGNRAVTWLTRSASCNCPKKRSALSAVVCFPPDMPVPPSLARTRQKRLN